MSSEFEFLEDKNILYLKSSLIYRSQHSIQTIQEIMDLVIKYKYPNVLGDFRGLNINFSLLSAIEKPKQWKQVGISRNIKIVALFDKIDDKISLRINRLFSFGYKVSIFTDYNEAIKWLMD
jgi:hypothetical protein